MATASQVAASRLNGSRGRGPVSVEGLRISRMNSLKHGFRSERVAEEVESSSALEERRRTWLANAMHRRIWMNFLLQATWFSRSTLNACGATAAACLDSEKENADDKAIEQVRELASRLYFDPTGPTSKYGIERVVFDKVGTSSSGGAMKHISPRSLSTSLRPRR